MIRPTLTKSIAIALTTGALVGTCGIWTEAPLFDGAMRLAYAITDDSGWVVRLTFFSKAFLVAVVAAAIALALYRCADRHGPAEPGDHLCVACNYPLRGLTSNKCPECGTPFAARPAPYEAGELVGREPKEGSGVFSGEK